MTAVLSLRGATKRFGGLVAVNDLDFDVAEALVALARVNPAAIVFGTDLPSTRAPRPFEPADVQLVHEALGKDGAELVLERNAERIYGRA